MPTYKLSLFGGFDLADDQGAPITVASKKGRCLFAYLALAAGQHTHRDILAELFWGDRDDTRARRSLSQELYRLRRLFPKETHDRFHHAGDTVGLSEDFLDVDVVRFERGLDSGESEAIVAAAALYTGDLLGGLRAGQEGFDGWVRSERERLRDRTVAAWHDIVRTQMEGPTERAIESASRPLAIDPTGEAGHRALMRLYEKSGRRDMALRQYEKCKQQLSAELGIEPDSETRELHQRIGALPQRAPVEAGMNGSVPRSETTSDRAGPVPDKASIAVLPFVNMSGDPEQEYFSDGVTEDIITTLSKVKGLFVTSRGSTFTYKGRSVKVQEVGRELDASHVVEGSVRRAGDRIRVSAQLVEAATGHHLGAERYDRRLEDIFAVQDELSAEIARALEVELGSGDEAHPSPQGTDNIEAYDLFLRSREITARPTKESMLKARQLMEEAIALDPDYAPALARLAQTYAVPSQMMISETPTEDNARAYEFVGKALALDGTLAFAHGVMAQVHLWRKEYERAVAESARWTQLSPNDADGYLNRAAILTFVGRPTESLPLLDKSMRLNPHYSSVTLFGLGHAYFSLRRYEEAAENLERAWEHNPSYWITRVFLVAAWAALGKDDMARAEVRKWTEETPRPENLPYARAEDLEHLCDAVRKAGWPARVVGPRAAGVDAADSSPPESQNPKVPDKPSMPS